MERKNGYKLNGAHLPQGMQYTLSYTEETLDIVGPTCLISCQ